MPTSCNRILIYTAKMDEMIHFYGEFFVYQPVRRDGDRIVELHPAMGGLTILLHPAAKGQKQGQSAVKLVFDVKNVEAFQQQFIKRGIKIGPIHQADGYQFANLKDPSGNSISISNRAFVLPNE